jgi:uncharacterized protein YggE
MPYVQASGTATIYITPNQAMISLSVVTQAQTADAASSQNATQVSNVEAQLMGLLGPNANIITISYVLSPVYNYPQGGQPLLTGYTATNTIQVTLTNLTLVGKVIDAAIQAGANQVTGLQFGLQNSDAANQQALQAAVAEAKGNATAMAAGLGMHIGTVQVLLQGTSGGVVPVVGVATAAGATTTPIQAGPLSISATVTLSAALTQ